MWKKFVICRHILQATAPAYGWQTELKKKNKEKSVNLSKRSNFVYFRIVGNPNVISIKRHFRKQQKKKSIEIPNFFRQIIWKIERIFWALKMFSVHGVPLLYSLLVISLGVCGNHALEDYTTDNNSDHDDILQPPGKIISIFKRFTLFIIW